MQACSHHSGKLRAHRIGEADVRHQAFAKKSGDPAARAVEKLVGDHELQRRMFFLQRSHRAERHDALDAQRLESVNIRAKVQLRRRMAMAAAVARQKRDLFARELPDDIRVRRHAPRRFDRHFFVRGKAGHRIEAAPADNSDGWFLHS